MTDDPIRRAEEARRLIESPMVAEALFAMKAEIMAEWERAPARDTEGRERLWAMFKTVEKFKLFFAGVMESGVVEKHKVQQLRVGQV